MKNYKNYIKILEDNAHLISMVPIESLLRFGYEIGLNGDTKVLDLCCGYGTLLKVWSEAFGIYGVGVDRDESFISVGKDRLRKSNIDNIKLICEDVTVYEVSEKYDVVVCSETIGSIQETISLGEKYLQSGGILAYQRLYAKTENVPRELMEFDGDLFTLSRLNEIFNSMGYYMISMASDTIEMWEHYVINWSGKRDLDTLNTDRNNTELKNWIKYWYDMYFEYRRQYEGQGMFGLKKYGGKENEV